MSKNKFSKLLNEWENQPSKNYDSKEIDNCFNEYIEKIKKEELSLDDYTNRKSSLKDNKGCDYLCNFIENTSAKFYGSASAGKAYYFGIKKNDDGTYFIYKDVTGDKNIEKANKEEAEKYFKKISNYLYEIVNTNEIHKIKEQVEENNIITSKVMLRKIVAMHNVGNYLYIYSDEMINTLYRFFVEKDIQDEDLTNIEKNEKLIETLKSIGFKKKEGEEDKDYIIRLSSFIWDKFDATIDFSSKNIILHGAPGTGKTYMTERTIKNQLIFLEDQNIDKQYNLVQFHPSFGYEEFIDGIKPSVMKQNNGNIQLELVNGIFKNMCINAFEELIQAKKENREAKKFYFVSDEINRAELSRVFGELLLCLEEDKRLSLKQDRDKKLKLDGKSTRIKTQNSMLWTKEHAVVIFKNDEIISKCEAKQYDDKDLDFYFGVPENLYFIGTMNDIDRSVDSFDMALRRRFIWKHYTYDEKVVKLHYEKEFNEKKLEHLPEYLKRCKALNNYIVSENGFNLPESYMLGHFYFMNLSSFNKTQLETLWNEKISPLLIEYLRINFEGKKLDDKLKCTKKIFFGQGLNKSCK